MGVGEWGTSDSLEYPGALKKVGLSIPVHQVPEGWDKSGK